MRTAIADELNQDIDPVYDPFVMKGEVSLTASGGDGKSISILRDTGAAISCILESALPFSDRTYCGSDVLLKGDRVGDNASSPARDLFKH